jgi:tetratricopeptide (TPR) repeat protein/DNA-binding XRE family transcriptional regulator
VRPPGSGLQVGSLLRRWRERARLTQEQLAEQAGLNVRTIRRVESGAAKVQPRKSSLRLLAAALDLSEAEHAALEAASHGTAVPASSGEVTDHVAPSLGVGSPLSRSSSIVLSTLGQSDISTPRQLPPPPPLFVGRSSELAALERVRNQRDVVLASIDGMAGVGKTAFALHAAHLLLNEYPDAQLFLDLHGFTEGMGAVQPAEALDRLLRALGVPGDQIPDHVEDRAALYRSQLADRKVLVVLDNAASESQVRPLLPGSPDSLVLVTSRRRLVGLDLTLTVSLDVLSQPNAIALFTQSASAVEDTVAVAQVVELCGRLPLAIRIAAARLRSRPSWAVAHLVERLRGQRDRLGALEVGERSVAAALDMSYLQLGPDAQRAYRLCGPLPVASFDLYAAAALVDAPLDRAGRLLDDLLDAHLLQELVPGRYGFHDLVRVHASAAAKREEPDRLAAFGRLFDHYCHSASVAMDVLYPFERERRSPVFPAGSPAPEFRCAAQAAAWLDSELSNLLTAARYAAEFCPRDHTVHLSTTLERHLRTRDRDAEAEVLHHQALIVARRSGDAAGEADVLTWLGHVNSRQGLTTLAADRYEQALAVARSAGNSRAEVEARLGLGVLLSHQGNHETATEHFELARQLARGINHRCGEAEALFLLGWLHLLLREPVDESAPDRRYERAAEYIEEGLVIARSTDNPISECHGLVGRAWVYRVQGRNGLASDAYAKAMSAAERIGNSKGEFEVLNGIGRLAVAAGRPHEALTQHKRALELATDLRQPLAQARSHDGLARAHLALGRRDEARHHWHTALDILTGLGTNITADDVVSTSEIRTSLSSLTDGSHHTKPSQPGRVELE